MKKVWNSIAILLALLTLFCACAQPAEPVTPIVFHGSFKPQTAGASAVELVVTLNTDGALVVTPGIMLNMGDDGQIVTDSEATGTWTKDANDKLIFTITAGGDETFVTEYEVEKIDGYYEFGLMLDLAGGYRRELTVTSEH